MDANPSPWPGNCRRGPGPWRCSPILAVVVMGYLLTSDDVRKHVGDGVPLRLR